MRWAWAGQAQDPIGSGNVQKQDQTSNGYEQILEEEDMEALLAEQPTGPGLQLMSRGDLEAAVGNMSSVGDWEDSGATSREEAVRQRELLRFRDDPALGWRPYLIGDDAMVARLGRLAVEAPNMARAVELVRSAAVLSRHGRQPLQIPPIVLVGPPGTGKSRLASKLGACLQTSAFTLVGSSIQDTGPLTGYGPAWKGAGPGVVAKSLLSCPTATPLIVIDEAEKISSYDRRDHPLDTLLSAMEPSTAAKFKDNWYDVPMRAEYAAYVIVTNTLTGLSQPLLDRCVVIDVPELSPAERHRALDEVVSDLVLDYGILPRALDTEFLAMLDGVGLRRARTVVGVALARALEDGRDWPGADDVRAALMLTSGRTPAPARPAGFLTF